MIADEERIVMHEEITEELKPIEKFRRVLHQNSKAPDIPADILDKVGAAGDVPHP